LLLEPGHPVRVDGVEDPEPDERNADELDYGDRADVTVVEQKNVVRLQDTHLVETLR
jgi:hypothetical protein